ncbi:uncharacterized protein LOC119068087 [Bradysia coprophila]|uniref:uncharacterized protein LOC119068087 n=1 Tax=Bradysia coprophila TaxID=38358 RepID=UPI00187D7E94|nr:uncharacterized protein LOC119068087 [Bradysia coprophila]
MKLCNFAILCIVTVTFFSFIMITTAWVDYDLVVVETMNDTAEPMEYKITKKRADRFTFVIDGTVGFTDLNGCDSELKIYYSAPDSTKFALSPFKLPRAPIEQALNQDYRKYLMNPLKDFSDLPYSEDEEVDLYKEFLHHKFTINKFLLHNTTIPADLADGTYKCYLFIYKGLDVLNAIHVMLRLY